ncbi:hypothetical protein MMC07_000662 [Pseudocyphellaria aurata]|nr:hypothetical protein [Pseudocyphellaria aurata]
MARSEEANLDATSLDLCAELGACFGQSVHSVNEVSLESQSKPKNHHFRKLSHGTNSTRIRDTSLTLFRDIDQPFVFDVRMYNRPYRFEFYDTASPEDYTLLRPDFVVICYAINDRQTLANAPAVWRKEVTRNYAQEREDIPVMLLGLKRDLRVEGTAIIYPQEVSGDIFHCMTAD